MPKRRDFSNATRAERFKLCGGRCEGILESGERCNAILIPGRWHCDHDLPDAMGGEPTLANARCLCVPCHTGVKTPADAERIARAKRQEAAHLGAKAQPKQPIRSAGFQKRPKRQPRPPLPPRALYERR